MVTEYVQQLFPKTKHLKDSGDVVMRMRITRCMIIGFNEKSYEWILYDISVTETRYKPKSKHHPRSKTYKDTSVPIPIMKRDTLMDIISYLEVKSMGPASIN